MPAPSSSGATDPSRQLHAERRRLLLAAYRICGSWADAEDVVQQAWLEWLRVDRSVDNPVGWLTRTVVRRAIDEYRARRRAAHYEGPWLPEPLVGSHVPDPLLAAEHGEQLSMAFLLLAEALTPLQRAVLVLRSLEHSHAEIGGILGLSPAASRQHHARALRRLHAASADMTPRNASAPVATNAETEQLLSAFLAAARDGELSRLESLLHADVRAYQDGGGNARAARRLLMGVRNVARFAVGVADLNRARRSAVPVSVNGAPGAIITLSGVRHVVSLEVRGGWIHRVFDVCNPAKLTSLSRLERLATVEAA